MNYGLILDLDGVIASNFLIFAVHDNLKKVSQLIDPNHVNGLGTEELIDYLENKLRIKVKRKLDIINNLSRAMWALNLKTKGIENVLEGFDKKVILSNSSKKNILSVLLYNKLNKFFEKSEIISAQEFTHLKPSSEVLNHACEVLNLPPQNCIVVDDSITNLVFAKTMGFKTFGYVGRYKQTDKLKLIKKMQLAKIDEISDDILDVLKYSQETRKMNYEVYGINERT
jgi:HAD superfamily hydrolase (TIGR01509 family)